MLFGHDKEIVRKSMYKRKSRYKLTASDKEVSKATGIPLNEVYILTKNWKKDKAVGYLNCLHSMPEPYREQVLISFKYRGRKDFDEVDRLWMEIAKITFDIGLWFSTLFSDTDFDYKEVYLAYQTGSVEVLAEATKQAQEVYDRKYKNKNTKSGSLWKN